MAKGEFEEEVFLWGFGTGEEKEGPIVRTEYNINKITITIPDPTYFKRDLKIMEKDNKGISLTVGDKAIEDIGEIVKFRLKEIRDGVRHTYPEGGF